MKFKKYTQIFKLKNMLEESKIPFEFNEVYEGYQIVYPSDSPCERVISVIETKGSYGNTEDLLEIMGLLTDEELQYHYDNVIGFLTAKNVFDRINEHYKSRT